MPASSLALRALRRPALALSTVVSLALLSGCGGRLIGDQLPDFDSGVDDTSVDDTGGSDTSVPFDTAPPPFDSAPPPFDSGRFDTAPPPFDSAPPPFDVGFETFPSDTGPDDTGIDPFDTGIDPFDTGPDDTGITFDTAPPPLDTGTFDSGTFDTGAGDTGGDGGILCGASSCDPAVQDCCASFGTFTCVDKGKCTTGAPLSCSSSASCKAGDVCCFSGGFGGAPSATCQPICFTIQLCQSSAECLGGRRCRPVFGGYKVCR